jgi:FKBP-type peptidyl-prolyl cis-trans isomerase FkpA
MHALAADLESEESKAFYCLGANVGRQLSELSVLDADEIECVLTGLRDILTGGAPQVDVQTYMPKATELFKAKQAAANAAANADQLEFLEAAAAGEGAVQTDSGLVIVETEAGEGASPAASDTVMVHYEGKLIDGSVFDSSIARGQPISFPLSGVIAGWTEGLQLMKEGGKATLTIPSEHGYGASGSPPTIPGGATLIFEVELIQVM